MTKGSVKFENVTKSYGEFVALKPLSIDIAPGTLCTLLGPSGCGKTTTLRLIAGLESATAGRILIGGQDVTHLSATYRPVSMVFQSYALFPHMTVLENVAYGLSVKRVPKAEAKDRAETGLELVGLSGFGSRLPSELSGGQQQRVAVARAIVLEPEVLLLDEPLSNLDAKLRRHVREEIRQIQQRLELTAVYVTHDQEEAMAVSDRIIVMKNAEIAQEGTPHDLYERPASAFIADFIGDANLLDTEVIATGDETRIRLLGQELTLPLTAKHTGAAKLVLRPHQVRIGSETLPGSLPAEVTYAAYLGNQIQYTLKSEAGEIFAVAPPVAQPFRQGDNVHFSLADNAPRIVMT
ncbi:ATP-binding cassette domain-containing protein [Sinorhizobium medicae]|nr:ATP-binding cassette domain-containing protein [Sinorhizobium medicae]MDX0759712.1 ATP-binding cassette domain-containing protein [Sinorhizobium medicae]MDX0762463.1 ATP-binding cassette domain-containing protein [Sinorhizobium medicae]MDX0796390.1 ATP-binding cassette domain-containing protein [Sinorhizobium medicae]MDX0817094.1 ATP-binding cassette domain-containing protein [Sinorhizobium medicae]